jgi:hypothetical protein
MLMVHLAKFFSSMKFFLEKKIKNYFLTTENVFDPANFGDCQKGSKNRVFGGGPEKAKKGQK